MENFGNSLPFPKEEEKEPFFLGKEVDPTCVSRILRLYNFSRKKKKKKRKENQKLFYSLF